MLVTRSMPLLRPIETRWWGMAERLLIAVRGKRPPLRGILGVGPRRVCEIEASLVLARLNLTGHQEWVPLRHATEDPCPQRPQP